MLWLKGWWETRRGFLIYSVTMITIVIILLHTREPADLAKWTSSLQTRASRWSDASRQLLPLFSSYHGYVWSYWFKMILLIMWPVYAITMGATMVATSCQSITGAPDSAGLFTFSLPVSRRKVLLTHAALVAVEMVLVALAPSLFFFILAYLVGGEVSFGKIVIHALLLSLSGMVFPAFSFLLSAVFNDQRKVLAIGIAVVLALFFPLRPVEEFPWWNIYHVMSGETYFRYGQIPWLGLFASLVLSALMMLAVVRIFERRDI